MSYPVSCDLQLVAFIARGLINLVNNVPESTEWVPVLKGQGWEAIHWSHIGDPGAPDEEILRRGKKWLISA
jgi:hypothetical protein